MKLTQELFNRYTVIEENLLPYGFRKEENAYFYSHFIHNGDFDLQVTVKNQRIDARLMEVEFDEEYTLINVERGGNFVASLKKECEDVLLDIREKCCKEENFIFPQTNRIADLIYQKYRIKPELMHFGPATNFIFRNPVSKKWIGLLMYNKRSSITGDSEKRVECLNLNFKKDGESFNMEGVYHPFKKRNSNWVVIIMDDSLPDQQVMDLVEISYEKSF